MTRLSKVLSTAIAVSIATGLLLLGCELTLRLRERIVIRGYREASDQTAVIPSDIPGLNYTLRPSYRHGDIRFNRLGFNMREVEADKPAGTTRIIFVGDSVTQGTGIEATEEAFPNWIQRRLQSVFAGQRVEAWNAGVGGYNAEQILLLMQHVLPAYEPDILIYTFNFNDYWEPNQYFLGQPGIPPDQISEGGERGLLDWLKQIRLARLTRDAYGQLAFRVRGYSPVYVDRKIHYPSWTHLKSVMAAMNDYCGDNSVLFLVVVHPNEQFLHVSPEKNLAHRDICSFLETESIPYLDLIPCLKPHRRDSIYLSDGDHMTPRGYALVAECVFDWLVEESIIRPHEDPPA